VVPATTLETALDSALRDGATSEPFLRWRLEQCAGRRGTRTLAAMLVDRAAPRPESWLERRTIRVLERAGLPAPRRQRRYRLPSGRVARVDFVYEEQRLVVEVAGHATHATRRQRQADAQRSSELLLLGWRVLTFTYEDVVERPDWVTQVVAAALAMDGAA
jgi:very-short-patch-repair endonuclease